MLHAYYEADDDVVSWKIQSAMEGDDSGYIHPYLLDDWLDSGDYDLDRIGYLYKYSPR